MKGLLFFDIYHSILPLLNPHAQSKFTSLNKKFKSLALAKTYRTGFVGHSSYFGLLIPTLFFIKTKNDFNWALASAAYSGQLKLCQFFIKAGAIYFNTPLANSAQGGHLNLCHFFIKAGATHFNWALANAAQG